MTLDQYRNFATSSLTADITSSETTIPVADAAQFADPGNGNYNVVVLSGAPEIIRVTGRDTGANELTVQRGQESTSAVSHGSGTEVTQSVTAKLVSDVRTELNNKADTNQRVETFSTASATPSGEVPVSQGDGTLQMEPQSSGGGNERLSLSQPITEWADGLSNRTVQRLEVGSSEEVNIQRIEFRALTQTSTSASVRVYVPQGGVEIASANLGQTVRDPAQNVAAGDSLFVQLTNQTGGPIEAGFVVTGEYVPSGATSQ
jgi:hypothetical protein